MPVWVLLEVISFGMFLTLYRFCAQSWGDRQMLYEYYLMKQVKSIRNACAHGACTVNCFRPGLKSSLSTADAVEAALDKGGIRNSKTRRAKMGNPVVQQIVTTLYAHSAIVSSGSALARATSALHALSASFMEHRQYYSKNDALVSFFLFIGKVIDIWFPVAQDNGRQKKL
jgi:hypothetical protein